MTIKQELRDVAQEMVDLYGWSALDDRQRVMLYLADRGLLSPDDEPDERADRQAVDDVESHARWLLT